MESKTFSLGAVLGATTGKLLGDFGELHELIEYVCGYSVWTHQLPRIMDPVAEELKRQLPQIADVDGDSVDVANWKSWLTGQERIFGATLVVSPMNLPPVPVDPVQEACDMIGPEKVAVFPAPPVTTPEG